MNPNNVSSIKKILMPLSILAILLVTIGSAFACDASNVVVTPNVTCVNGENITITGNANPGDYVPIVTTYSMYVPIINGTYYFDAGMVPIPPGSISASIIAYNVKDMTIETNLVVPLSHTFEAKSDGRASATAPIGRGTYPLIVSGNALESGSAITNCVDEDKNTSNEWEMPGFVKLTFISRMEVKADENGYFEQICCSDRPAGNYTLEVGRNKVKNNVTLIDCDDSDNSSSVEETKMSSSSSSSSSGTGSAKLVKEPSNIGNATNVSNSTVNVTVATPQVNAEKQVAQLSFESIIDAIMNMIRLLLNGTRL